VEFSDGTYGILEIYGRTLSYFNSRVGRSYNNTSDPDERGNRLVLPVTGMVRGVWMNTGSLYGARDACLYDERDNLLGSVSEPGPYWSIARGIRASYFPDGEVPVTGGQVYRVTMLPTTATNALLAGLDVEDNFRRFSMGGDSCYETYRTNGGAWTDDDTVQLAIGLIYSQIALPEEVPEGRSTKLLRAGRGTL
jgi:hypothetical protein